MKQTKDCPKCRSKNGWFEHRKHYGDQYFDSAGDTSHFVEARSTGGSRKFCSECGRDITKCVSEETE